MSDFVNKQLSRYGLGHGGKRATLPQSNDAAANEDGHGVPAAGPSNSSIRPAFKRGGAISGEAGKANLGRVMRKKGGKVACRADGGNVPDVADKSLAQFNKVKPMSMPPPPPADVQANMIKKVNYKSGGRVTPKGKTVVNIVVGGDKGQQAQPVPVPVPVPGGPPPGAMPPGAGPMPAARAPTPPIPIPIGPGGGGLAGPGGAGPVIGRKNGGAVTYPQAKAGARSGEGRLDKIKDQKKFNRNHQND